MAKTFTAKSFSINYQQILSAGGFFFFYRILNGLRGRAEQPGHQFFEHDPVYECCNLQQTERGIRPKDYFKLEEI